MANPSHGGGMRTRALAISIIIFISSSCGTNEPVYDETAVLDKATAADARAGFRAIELKIENCMRALGFNYVPVDPGEATTAGGVVVSRNSLNKATTSSAEQAAYDAALHGNDISRGCIESAASSEEPEPLDIDVYNQTRERTKATPAVVNAEVEWSQCMATQGIEVSSPDEMATLQREAAIFSEDGLQDLEISAMKSAALQCDDDYYSVFWQVFEEIGLGE